MAKNLSLRSKLLSTSALAVAGTFWLGASPALAVPLPGSCITAGSTAITITCSGNIAYQVYATDANTTVTLNPDANVFVGGDAAIHLDAENSSLVMGANSTAKSHGDGATRAVETFNGTDVTLNDGASITLEQNNLQNHAYALSIEDSDGSNIVLNGGSSINFTGGSPDSDYGNYRAAGISGSGEKINITLNGASEINVKGTGNEVENDYSGIRLKSTGETLGTRNTITLNGGSSINVTRAGTLTEGRLFGIYAAAVHDDNYAADITLNNSAVNVVGAGVSDAGEYVGILNIGAAARVTLNGSEVNVTGASASDGNKYMGVAVIQTNLSNAQTGGLALTNGSSVTVNSNGTGEYATLFGAIISSVNSDMKVGAVTMDGGSTITLNAGGDTQFAWGLMSKGYAPVVDLSNGSSVTINAMGGSQGAKYIGVVGSSIDTYATGVAGRITLNSGSSINVIGTGGASQSKYLGLVNFGTSPDGIYAPAVTLNDSSINVYGSGGTENKYEGILSLGGSTITLNGASRINLGMHYDSASHTFVGGGTDAKAYIGVLAFNVPDYAGPSVVLNGTSSVNIIGNGLNNTAKYLGIGIAGTDATLTLNSHASVTVYAKSEINGATGIFAIGEESQVTLNGDSTVAVAVNVGTGEIAQFAAGIVTQGSDNAITLNDNAHVRMFGLGDGAVYGAGVMLGGQGDTLTLNGHAQVEAYYANYVMGVYIRGDDATVTLNDHALIYGGLYAPGIYSQAQRTSIYVGKDASVVGGYGIQIIGDRNVVYVQGAVIGHLVAIDTSGGSNSSVTLDSAQIVGSVVGNGSDKLTLAGTGTLNEGFIDFGLVTMNGVHWNLATGSTNFADDVDVVGGRLAVNGDLTTDEVTVRTGGSLGGTGTITGTLTVLAGGTIAPGNSPGTLNVVGPVSFSAGSALDVEIGPDAADLLTATGAVTIAPGAVVNPIFFPGADGFVGDIVTGASVTGTFTSGSGAALDYSTPGVVSLTAASSSSMNGAMSAGAAQGFTFLDTVLSEARKSASVGKTLWGTALWSRSTRTAASTSSQGFDQHSNGGAFGGDVMSSGDFTLGLAAGYLDGDAITAGGGSRTSIEGYHAAVYSTYMFGGTYLTSAVSAAYQDQNTKRNVFAGGVLVGAQGSPDAWLGGVGLGIGHEFPLNNAFTITPRASLAYQHMARDGYTETGGGTGAFALDAIGTDTVRGRVGAELALNIADKNALWAIRPAISAALAQEWRAGDTTTTGTFRTTGAAFNNNLDSRNQTYLALGAGVDMTIGYGVTAFVNYDGGTGGDAESSGGWRLGARMEW